MALRTTFWHLEQILHGAVLSMSVVLTFRPWLPHVYVKLLESPVALRLSVSAKCGKCGALSVLPGVFGLQVYSSTPNCIGLGWDFKTSTSTWSIINGCRPASQHWAMYMGGAGTSGDLGMCEGKDVVRGGCGSGGGVSTCVFTRNCGDFGDSGGESLGGSGGGKGGGSGTTASRFFCLLRYHSNERKHVKTPIAANASSKANKSSLAATIPLSKMTKVLLVLLLVDVVEVVVALVVILEDVNVAEVSVMVLLLVRVLVSTGTSNFQKSCRTPLSSL